MEFYVDIADIEKVRAVNEYYPIDGFTTNPVILTRSLKDPSELFRDYREYIDETKQTLFVQVTSDTAEGMTAQAVKLASYFGDSLVVKLPAIREGYRALKMCKALGLRICVTMVHSVMQAVIAAKAGADYAAPYITHIDNVGADGVRCVREMLAALESAHSPCKILGASFRTVDQIERLAAAGCHAVTVTPEMFDALVAHPSTDASAESFASAWKAKFPWGEIVDFLPVESGL